MTGIYRMFMPYDKKRFAAYILEQDLGEAEREECIELNMNDMEYAVYKFGQIVQKEMFDYYSQVVETCISEDMHDAFNVCTKLVDQKTLMKMFLHMTTTVTWKGYQFKEYGMKDTPFTIDPDIVKCMVVSWSTDVAGNVGLVIKDTGSTDLRGTTQETLYKKDSIESNNKKILETLKKAVHAMICSTERDNIGRFTVYLKSTEKK